MYSSKRYSPKALLFCAAALGSATILIADWPTFGGDPARSGWAKSEDTFTKENVKNMGLQWKVTLDNQQRELNSLTPPVVLEGVITQKGFKEYVIVGGASDTLAAIDADTGKVVWKKAFQVDASKRPDKQRRRGPDTAGAVHAALFQELELEPAQWHHLHHGVAGLRRREIGCVLD